MIIARSLGEVSPNPRSFVTVGTFDGVHLGHARIIKELTTRAAARFGRSVLITFEPHPRDVVGRGKVKWLTSLDERLSVIGDLGIDFVLVIEFTYDFSRLSSREFYEKYVVRGTGVSEVILGFDHMFGRDREAGIKEVREMGQEFGFKVDVVDPVSIRGEVVSSTIIRELIHHGNIERAGEYLGRPFSIEGTVVKGDRRGRDLGFPTINVDLRFASQIIPADGVYAATVELAGKRFHGMSYIGVRPTFYTDQNRVIEVNMFDYNGDAYGSKVRVYFHKRIRHDKTFSTKDDLIAQLHIDRSECMKFIASIKQS